MPMSKKQDWNDKYYNVVKPCEANVIKQPQV